MVTTQKSNMQAPDTILCCDWGTSSFRLKLVAKESLDILEEESSNEGNAAIFQQWKEGGSPDRVQYYVAVLQKHITTLENKLQQPLAGVPIILSGMASSTVGMMELPYKELPFAADGSDLNVHIIEPSPDFNHKLVIISGAKSEDDVMRGEETHIIGCNPEYSEKSVLYISPGTHSKHIQVQGGKITAFKTYMTGEFFKLLTTDSILSASVQESDAFDKNENRDAFRKGVLRSKTSNLLHNSFLVRTNQLFRKLGKEENYFFLSGLLIGLELIALEGESYENVICVGKASLLSPYEEAYKILELKGLPATLQIKHSEKITVAGQIKIASHYLYNT